MDVHAKIMSSEFHRLPPLVQKAHLSAPSASADIEFCDGSFSLAQPREWDQPASQAFVPKLAVKSWRDVGTLGVIYAGVSMGLLLTRLLSKPSPQQLIIARVWEKMNTPLQVHLLPYVDYSEISEVRYLALSASCQRISACKRGATARLFDTHKMKLDAYAQKIAQELDGDGWIIDLALTTQGRIGVTEINPALSPVDLKQIGV